MRSFESPEDLAAKKRFEEHIGERLIRKATADEDIKNHIDYFTSDGTVDFKGLKRRRRGDAEYEVDVFLVEWQARRRGNVVSRIGWVRGDEDWVVFERFDDFVWAWRIELLQLVSNVNWESFTFSDTYDETYRAYRRRSTSPMFHDTLEDYLADKHTGCDDLFCYVPTEDILALPSTRIEEKRRMNAPLDVALRDRRDDSHKRDWPKEVGQKREDSSTAERVGWPESSSAISYIRHQ
jgi:hypothetical protein